jgi:hypothetical protein
MRGLAPGGRQAVPVPKSAGIAHHFGAPLLHAVFQSGATGNRHKQMILLEIS